MKHCEIERKWVLEKFPEYKAENICFMEQGYLSYFPNAVRIRKKTQGKHTSYTLTIKGKGTLRRTEVEFELGEETYNALRNILLGKPVCKEQRTYRLPGGEVLECNLVDEGEDTSFMYAEVEFESEAAAHMFVTPPCLGKEVTEQPGCTMAEYCRFKAGEGEWSL